MSFGTPREHMYLLQNWCRTSDIGSSLPFRFCLDEDLQPNLKTTWIKHPARHWDTLQLWWIWLSLSNHCSLLPSLAGSSLVPRALHPAPLPYLGDWRGLGWGYCLCSSLVFSAGVYYFQQWSFFFLYKNWYWRFEFLSAPCAHGVRSRCA